MSGHAEAAVGVDAAERQREFAADVRAGLTSTPRVLPSRYFYDDLGSALFDAICQLPWYPVTRAEMRLLRSHGRAILSRFGVPAHIVELGAGNGTKLAALLGSSAGTVRPTVHLVDVSAAALETAARTVTAAAPVPVTTHQLSYEDGLEHLRRPRLSGRALVLFLGSNLGNFEPDAAAAFLRHVRATRRPGDALLLGVDLVKPPADLLLAYDDPLGVTRAFDLNLLSRINRELAGDFDLGGFRHEARWTAEAARIEMHLVSRRHQRVRVARADRDLTLQEGESIRTEHSYKYTAASVQGLLTTCGFRVRAQWLDEPGGFALTLADC
ncbi:MAG: L-histidine N(alpha)-methyltransferase [Acidobacteria bacterium]|nr:L-histidine N(alpha)-methyltransferase [Acidobacteriota bacterium]